LNEPDTIKQSSLGSADHATFA